MMYKFLLCTAILTPCFVMPFMGTADEVISEYDTTSFEEAFFEPELEKLENCESANLDVFFSEGYVEYHSAEYLAEGIQAASACQTASYVIQPIEVDLTKDHDAFLTDAEHEELELFLKDHGVSAATTDPVVQEEFDSFLINGRSVILQIIVEDDDDV